MTPDFYQYFSIFFSLFPSLIVGLRFDFFLGGGNFINTKEIRNSCRLEKRKDQAVDI